MHGFNNHFFLYGFRGTDVIKLWSQNSYIGFTNSHLHKVENKQKMNPCTSFQSHSMFHFENTAIWTSKFSQCVTQHMNAILWKESLSSWFSAV